MRFSVVIPLFNKELYIERAITSVLKQTHPPCEILVIDDGSTDSGPSIVRKINAPRLRIISQRNSGVSASRNLGIALSKGDLISFLDADDQWLPSYLQTIKNLWHARPNLGLYSTGFRLIKGKSIYRDIRAKSLDIYYGNYFDLIDKGGLVCSSSVSIPKAVFDSVGYFRIDHCVEEDLEMWFRIAITYPIAYSSRICSLYYYGVPGSACVSQRNTLKSALITSFAEYRNSSVYKNADSRKIAAYVERKHFNNLCRLLISNDNTDEIYHLRQFAELFGRTTRYHILNILKSVPKPFLRKCQQLKLFVASIILKYKTLLSNCVSTNDTNQY